MTLKTEKWDVAKHLDTDEKIILFLDAVFEDGDAATITAAIGEVARIKGMGQIAGLSRNDLDSVLGNDGNAEFGTIMRAIRAIGFDLRVTPHASPEPKIISVK